MSSSVARSALGIAVVALTGAITLTACSSSSGKGSGGTDPASSSPVAGSPSGSGGAGGPGGAGGAGLRGPAASGTVAAVAGTTMQVQNPQSGQVAVAWTSSTKFSHQVAATLAAIKAGTCVTAIAPTGTSESAASFTATTVAINPSTNGSCTGGVGGGNGQRPSGFPSGQRPSGFPSGIPSGQRANVGAIAAGSVTSVSGSSVVIAARQFTPGGTGASGSSSTTNKTVTIGASTKITTEASTTASSVKVGKCVTAQGKADSSGTVAATTVRITDPVNGQCTTAFGGRRGNGG
jgi:hypothetical protein